MSGKGSKPRPLSVDREVFSDNWDKVFKKKSFWTHQCKQERTILQVEKNTACNWCGRYEDGSLD